VTREALLLTDAHRNLGSLCVIWLLLRCMRVTRTFLADGMLSVRRGWRVREWNDLASKAGIPEPKVWLYYGSRIVLQARRSPVVRAKPATTESTKASPVMQG
jgi:hypothetical protein